MSDPRYSFSPLERRGILLGLQLGQLAAIGAATLAALALHSLFGGLIGLVLGFSVLSAGVLSGVWSRQGQPLISWALIGMGWLGRRGGNARLRAAPLIGHGPVVLEGGQKPVGRPDRSRDEELPRGIRVVARHQNLSGEGYGVMEDRAAGSIAALVPVSGRPLPLLDPDEQAQCMEAWRTVLAALARQGSPVTRLQWVQRSGREDLDLDTLFPPVSAGAPPDASGSYRQLIDSVGRQVRRHETWLLLAVGGDRSPRAVSRMDALDRELRFLEGQLRRAGLDPGPPVGIDDLRRLAVAGGMAVKEHWSFLRIDDAWHATYWVAEWPRVEVGPGFLQPLLVTANQVTVSVLMASVPLDRALREVRSARTADLADAALRSRAGFVSSARREREAEGVARRESELADGHVEYRFSGYVTVSAGGEDELAVACAGVEQAAHSSHLELRRLYGRQAEAFTWTRPFGRGLR